MRLAVVGAGAIGAYLGASVARGGGDVVLVARGAHLAAMQASGVSVESPRGDFHAHPAATDDLAAIADADVVVVALKAYSLTEIAPRLAEHARPDAAFLWAQNGLPWWYFESEGGALDGATLESVDPGGAIARAIGPGRSIGCVAYPAAEIVAPGVIRHVEGTRFTLGEPDRTRSERCERLSAALVAGGLKAPIEDDVRGQIWLKLLGNATFNPLSALTGATLGQLGEVPAMLELLREAMQEIAAVAGALGVEIPGSIERRLEAGIGVGDHKTSMLQDLEAGKPLEHACMSGAVVELAGRLGVPVPRLQAIDAAIATLDHVQRTRA
ncbi:MAG: 2-dehydropantoate 2-reductase [Thermoleophilia bacterium]